MTLPARFFFGGAGTMGALMSEALLVVTSTGGGATRAGGLEGSLDASSSLLDVDEPPVVARDRNGFVFFGVYA